MNADYNDAILWFLILVAVYGFFRAFLRARDWWRR